MKNQELSGGIILMIEVVFDETGKMKPRYGKGVIENYSARGLPALVRARTGQPSRDVHLFERKAPFLSNAFTRVNNSILICDNGRTQAYSYWICQFFTITLAENGRSKTAKPCSRKKKA